VFGYLLLHVLIVFRNTHDKYNVESTDVLGPTGIC